MKDVSDDISSVLGLETPKERRAGGLPHLSRRWWIGGAVALVAVVLVFRFAGGPAGPRYATTEIVKGGLAATVTATGTLQPVNKVELGPEISGQIKKVVVDYNDRVKAGQVLAIMDTENQRARVLQSRASLASSRARVEDARATASESQAKLNRIRDLSARGNASKEALDTAEASAARARAAVVSAQAQVEVSQANLASDETTLSKAEIKSPIDGIVLSRKVEPGQVVAATFQTPVLFELAEDLTKMELVVDVDEADIGHVREGQQANFTVDAFQDRQFPATITQVRFAPKTVDNVVTYQAVLSLVNDDLTLRPGMTATATITTATRTDATLIPNGALRFRPPEGPAQGGPGFMRMFMGNNQPANPPAKAGATQRVWVQSHGDLKPVDIKVGLSDGQRTEVAEGPLKPGDHVVVGIQKPTP